MVFFTTAEAEYWQFLQWARHNSGKHLFSCSDSDAGRMNGCKLFIGFDDKVGEFYIWR